MKTLKSIMYISISIVFLFIIFFPLQHFYAQSVYIQRQFPEMTKNGLVSLVLKMPNDEKSWQGAKPIIQRIGYLPDSLLFQLAKKGIKLKLFTGSLTDYREAMHLKGVIPRGYVSNTTWDDVPGMGGGTRVLVKIGHSEAGLGHGSINLEYHELAHSVDRQVLQHISQNARFLDIWKKESPVLFPNHPYFLEYTEEYFAESFAMYYYSEQTKDTLRLKAPETYHYFKELERRRYELERE